MTAKKNIIILLVEDNPGDARLTKEAVRESQRGSDLKVVSDGLEALEFLRGVGRFERAVRPSVVILDWNLPKMGGAELLGEIRKDARLKDLSVVVLSSSSALADIKAAKEGGANAYFTKPSDFEEFIAMASSIEDFYGWATDY